MGGDDSIFFLENLVDVLAKYDHNKYYYFGASSYGGAGFIMSFPLAKDIESCLRRCPFLKSAHHITMACIVDLGVSFSPLKGLYQIDMHGDISGLLSSHPKAPLMPLHHFDAITPIFPSMDRTQSIEHFMKAAKFDQSRMLQQIICHHRPSNWTFSVS
uniref:Glycosyltransferase n=1 Tax=Solanum tuberosum TaxID=4113 RepID=M1A083_SOLTU